MTTTGRSGVLLMTYGSPASLSRDGIGAYLERVRGGRAPDADLVDEFTRRYQVIGGSPLIDITRRQAAVLAGELGWPVEAGMRFSPPTITDALRALLEQRVESVAAIILSPQYSPMLMGGYSRAIEAARAEIGAEAPHVEVAGAWHEEREFIGALGARIRAALDDRSPSERAATRVLLTAHSLPLRVSVQEPDYLAQLRATAHAVADAAALSAEAWTFCWQSAGHEPGEWMKPDFADLMPAIASAGGRSVIVAPVQFLADHLETLYDIDVGAREQAQRHGLRFDRLRSLNDDPALARALANVARRALAEVAQPV